MFTHKPKTVPRASEASVMESKAIQFPYRALASLTHRIFADEWRFTIPDTTRVIMFFKKPLTCFGVLHTSARSFWIVKDDSRRLSKPDSARLHIAVDKSRESTIHCASLKRKCNKGEWVCGWSRHRQPRASRLGVKVHSTKEPSNHMFRVKSRMFGINFPCQWLNIDLSLHRAPASRRAIIFN